MEGEVTARQRNGTRLMAREHKKRVNEKRLGCSDSSRGSGN